MGFPFAGTLTSRSDTATLQIMAYLAPLIPLAVGGFKIYQNMQPDAREANSDEMRKQGIVDRLSSGTNSRVSQMSDKNFEKFVRHNSVGRHCEAELREKRAESKPEDSTFGPVTSLGTPMGARAQSIKRAQSKQTALDLAQTDSAGSSPK